MNPLSKKKRKLVFKRAYDLCEYCLMHKSDLHVSLQIEHIIAKRHFISNELSNLASACYLCNRLKGTDLATVLDDDFDVVRLYRPRTDLWIEHFEFLGAEIKPKTIIGVATIKLLELNSYSKILDRKILSEKGWFPHPNVELYFENQHAF